MYIVSLWIESYSLFKIKTGTVLEYFPLGTFPKDNQEEFVGSIHYQNILMKNETLGTFKHFLETNNVNI